LFDVYTIPLSNSQNCVFLAQAAADARPSVFVLDGNTLTIYPVGAPAAPSVITLEPGTSAFDVADINGDGRNEIIAVFGDRIVRYPIPAAGEASAPQNLFMLHTQLGVPGVGPYPHVLAIQREGRTLIALPCENTFELRSADGKLVSSYPIGVDAPRRVSYGSPFLALSDDPAYLGRGNALQMSVDRHIEFVPELPPDIMPEEIEASFHRERSYYRMRVAAEREIEEWPWFPLKTDGSTLQRVLFASSPRDALETLVRIRENKSPADDLSEKGATTGPERRYPGVIVLTDDDLPDFNHDGYTDLLLWKAPMPGITVDALTRALTGRSWPLQLAVHLFSPEKRRYEPTPSAHIACTVPIDWFFMMEDTSPIRCVALRDFNGDGHTDMGCCVAPHRFSVWLYGDKGFAEQPDFTQTFPEPVTRLAFCEDLDGKGHTSLGIRTQKALYVLLAQ
jgi:hypothetical protein